MQPVAISLNLSHPVRYTQSKFTRKTTSTQLTAPVFGNGNSNSNTFALVVLAILGAVAMLGVGGETYLNWTKNSQNDGARMVRTAPKREKANTNPNRSKEKTIGRADNNKRQAMLESVASNTVIKTDKKFSPESQKVIDTIQLGQYLDFKFPGDAELIQELNSVVSENPDISYHTLYCTNQSCAKQFALDYKGDWYVSKVITYPRYNP